MRVLGCCQAPLRALMVTQCHVGLLERLQRAGGVRKVWLDVRLAVCTTAASQQCPGSRSPTCDHRCQPIIKSKPRLLYQLYTGLLNVAARLFRGWGRQHIYLENNCQSISA